MSLDDGAGKAVHGRTLRTSRGRSARSPTVTTRGAGDARDARWRAELDAERDRLGVGSEEGLDRPELGERQQASRRRR